MDLIPTQPEVIDLLRSSGALRQGHFACPSEFHTDQYLEMALVMRHYRHAKTLSVGLSRLIRANTELRAMISELSIVAASPAGLPVAYGLCEALRARQVYWAEKPSPGEPMNFRQFLEQSPGEKVLLVDDLLRSGVLIEEARVLLESRGARVLALAVLIYQPTPHAFEFGALPLYCLARLDVDYYAEPGDCDLCRRQVPLEQIGRASLERAVEAAAGGM